LQYQCIGIMLNYALVIRNKGAEIAIIAFALAERDVYVKPQGLAVLSTKHLFTPILILIIIRFFGGFASEKTLFDERLSVVVSEFKHRHKGFRRNLDRAELTHLLFTLFLLFKQLLFSGDITAVALCKNVLTHSLYGLSGNNL